MDELTLPGFWSSYTQMDDIDGVKGFLVETRGRASRKLGWKIFKDSEPSVELGKEVYSLELHMRLVVFMR